MCKYSKKVILLATFLWFFRRNSILLLKIYGKITNAKRTFLNYD